MNTLLLSINWNPNPELFNLFGLSIRYYGLLWAVGIFLAYVIVHYQYRDKKIDEKKFDPLFFYCFFGILIGARLIASWSEFISIFLTLYKASFEKSSSLVFLNNNHKYIYNLKIF